MGYQTEMSGPERPALISLRVGGDGLPALERALGVPLPGPAGLASESRFITVFGLGPDEWLVRTRHEDEDDWLARLREAAAGSFSAVVLVSDAWRVFTIAGPGTLDVLAQATGVDVHPSVFPTGRAVRAGFASISALIHRRSDRPSFDVYVDTSLARYTVRWIESATGARPAARQETPHPSRVFARSQGSSFSNRKSWAS